MTDTTHAALVEAMARAIREAPLRDVVASGKVVDVTLPLLPGDTLRARAALSALRTARPDVAALLDNEAVAVPREATDAMYNAGYDAMHRHAVRGVGMQPGGVYVAMLAASPWSKRDE